jgi:predicted dehydrogenase
MSLRVGFIGAGHIANFHAGHVTTRTDIEVVGFCDADPDRAASTAERYGTKAFPNHNALIAEAKPEAVFICVPPSAHGPIEDACIQAGVHLFVEKPVALEIGTARRIRAAAESRGLVTAAGKKSALSLHSSSAGCPARRGGGGSRSPAGRWSSRRRI